jgi:hypothetical protein
MPVIHDQFRAYRAALQDDRRHLLERFEIVDAARKVVGVTCGWTLARAHARSGDPVAMAE